MAISKKFLTFSQQIEYLKTEKGIIISDEKYAKDIIQHIGYFPLMGGYKELFRIPFSKKYKPGTSFDEIVALYQFDANLRELFLKYLLQIERHIGNLIAYYFIDAYGIFQIEYLDPNNYNYTNQNRKIIHGLMRKLHRAVTTSDYSYVNYYRSQYGNLPLWITINILTFGSISKMYKVLPQPLRSKICRHFPAVHQKQLERFLSVLTKYRNVCAHNDRLFTYRTVDQILDTPLHAKMVLPKRGNQYMYGKQDLFAVAIAFRYLLPKENFITFQTKLAAELLKINSQLIHITEDELMSHMGFPENWKDITRYHITT